MPSVYASPQKFNGGFRANTMLMQVAGQDVEGMLFQNVQFSFTQQITMLYEIGSNNVYYVGGRAQGTSTIARVVGPALGAVALIENYGDLCNPQDIGFSARSGCTTGVSASTLGRGLSYTLKFAVLSTVAGAVNSNDIVVNEQLQFMFIDLVYRR
jgi:hypothetical protein